MNFTEKMFEENENEEILWSVFKINKEILKTEDRENIKLIK